ncbi:MAG TPA: protein kinase [Phycisphaerae bacterium]|nr:protein kinase [Phycisphaerae bacterium]HRW52988.1 protein kinase [Phycisphaerae bacterium]
MISRRQFERASELFQRARELPPPERRAMLEETCADDPIVLGEVESLLAHDASSTSVVDRVDLGKGRDLLAADLECDNAFPTDNWAPERIDKYRIIRQIGRGGMGIVYEAEQDSPRRRVALKVLSAESTNVQLLKRFKREADVLGQLHHPGIAKVYDAGVAELNTGTGAPLLRPFFAMELIPGERLDVFVTAHAPSLRQRIELFAKICDAVHHAHERGFIHRDLKPGNIFVEPGGQPKVLDFGVARPTRVDADGVTLQTNVGQLIGTIPYMSPEQLSGDPQGADRRSDIYALGVCLYEILSGRLPHDLRGKLIHEAARVVIEDEQTSLASIDRRLAGDIDTIVGKALEKDPTRRYQTADELGGDLRRFLCDEPISARPPTTAYQIRKFARRNRAFVTAAMIAVVSLLAATIASSWWALTANRAREAEIRERRAADASAALARANELQMRRLAYRTTLSAVLANADSDRAEARRHLDLAPAELRGWEWKHLSYRVGRPAIVIDRPASAAWNREGRPIAAAVRDGTIRVFDIQSRRTLTTIRPTNVVGDVSISPDAALVIANTGEDEGTAFDATNGDVRFRFTDWPKERYPIFFTDASRFCLIGSGLRSLVFRDLTSGEAVFRVELPDGLLAIRRDPESGAAVAYTRNFESTFDIDEGRMIRDWRRVERPIMCAVSDDRSLRAAWSNWPSVSALVIRNQRDGTLVRELHPHTGGSTHVRFSPCNRYLMTAGVDDQLRIWALDDGRQLTAMAVGSARWMDFSSDSSSALLFGDDGAFLLNWRHPPPSRILDEAGSYIYEVCYSPDGKLLASAGWDQTVRIYDTDDGTLTRQLPLPCHHMGALGFNEDGTQLIALAYSDHWIVSQLAIWDVATGRRIPSDAAMDVSADSLEASQESDGNRPQVGFGAEWWRRVRGGSKATRFDGGEHMAKSHDGAMLAHAQYRGALVILDLETLEPRVQLVGHEGEVRAVAFSPDDRLLASGGDDRTLRVWEVATGRLLATMTGHSQKIFTVTFTPDGSRIVSGGNDHVIRFWDTASFGQVFALPGHESYVHSLAFSPDGRQLASGSGDKTVRIWDSSP